MSIHHLLELSQLILLWIGAIVGVCLLVWQMRLYFQLKQNAQDIRDAQSDVVGEEAKVLAKRGNNLITNDQLNKMTEKAQEPHRRKIASLEREREFIKDKLWFTKK